MESERIIDGIFIAVVIIGIVTVAAAVQFTISGEAFYKILVIASGITLVICGVAAILIHYTTSSLSFLFSP